MIRHIAIDVVRAESEIEEGARQALSGSCNLVYGNEELSLSVYKCPSAVIYVQRLGESLLIDIVGREDSILDSILRVLPKHSVMIRLIERGLPEG